jgi:hypothetical protein
MSSSLAADVQKSSRPLMPVMAGGEDRGKCHYDENPHHDDHQQPSWQAGMDVSSSRALPLFG